MGKKYSAQYKINAVLHYLNSYDGSRLTARRFVEEKAQAQQLKKKVAIIHELRQCLW